MRYLIISDMHGNLEALSAVLERARAQGYDEVLMLGDLVGYGASPNEVVETIRHLARPVHSVRGNHDKVVVGIDDGFDFNRIALLAARWSAERLSEENRRFLEGLPEGPLAATEDLFLCHGSPVDEDNYILTPEDAYEAFQAHAAKLMFFGHTHVPTFCRLRDDEVEVSILRGDPGPVRLDPEDRYLVNPGSVGQPRDGDPRASYMIYDSDGSLVIPHRVDYPVQASQGRILDADLPRVLADRLALGL